MSATLPSSDRIEQTPLADSFGIMLRPRTSQPLATLDPADVRTSWRRHGAVLLRGFTSGLVDFDAFASTLAPYPVVNGNPTRRSLVPSRDIETVNGGREPIACHAEMAYGPLRPDVLCFYCVQPPRQMTGETLLCDGVELWRHLPPALRARFESQRLKYCFSRSRMLALQCEGHEDRILADQRVRSYVRHDDGTVDLEFVVTAAEPAGPTAEPAFANSVIVEAERVSFEDDVPIEREIHRDLLRLSMNLAHPIAWEAADILIVDNSRIMHGRRRIAADDGRQIALKMGWESA